MYMLFTMDHLHLYAKLVMDMLCQMLSTIYTSVLPSSTPETKHQTGETTLDIPVYMMIGYFIYTVKESKNLSVIFQESNYRLIKSGELFIRFITAGIMGTSAVKNITSAIAGRIFRNTIAE